MTVSTSAAKAGPYTGNDVTSSFAFSFKVFADADIRVVETLISTEVETDLVLNTNYTVSRNADQDNNPGGTITYKVAGVTTALPSTKKLTIVGDFDFQQPTDIPSGSGFSARIVETALDRTTLLVKQLKVDVDRAVKVDVSSSTDPDELIDDLIDSTATAVPAAAAASASQTAAASSASSASTSAAAAQAAAASVMWNDVSFKTFADSPITIGAADYGKMFAIDATGGNVVVNLPQISGLDLSLPWAVGVKKTDATANTVTINRAGTDTIDGATSKTISTADAGATLIPDTDTAPDEWTSADFGVPSGQTKKQQFSGGGVDFTAGVTTTLTITETPIPSTKDSLSIYFDAAYQQESEWSYNPATGVVTFNAAISVGTAKVEAVWDTPLSIGTPADGSVSAAKLSYSAVNGQTAETAPATGDELLLADVSAAALRKMTLANMLKVINALTEDTAPDAAADYLLSYDGSASGVKKVLLGRLGGWVLHSTQSASGSAVSFGSIPSWATEIEVTVVSLSTNGANSVVLQLGDAGGYETSGYVGSVLNEATTASFLSSGFSDDTAGATVVRHGVITLKLHEASSITWTCHGVIGFSHAAGGRVMAGSKALSQALDSVRLSTADTFDGGTVTLRYRA